MIRQAILKQSQRFVTSFRLRTREDRMKLNDFLVNDLNLPEAFVNRNSALSIDDIANATNSSLSEIGDKIASFLEVPYLSNLTIPRSALTSATDQELTPLREGGSLVQYVEEEDKWFLVTSDPRSIKLDKFHNSQIVPAIASRKGIGEIWNRIDTLREAIKDAHTKNAPWKAALIMSIVDAKSLGAKELFFGMPDSDSYEFVVNGRRYGGGIDKNIITEGLSILERGEERRLALQIDPDALTRFYQTTYKGKDVFVCSWGPEEENRFEDSSEEVSSVVVFPGSQKVKDKTEPRKKHILLIDDDVRFAELLKRTMTAKGFSVSIASSVNDALLLYLESDSDIDLVVTDLHMPQANGTELIEMVRAKRKKIPVIVLTSDQEVCSHIEVLHCGGDAIVSKGDDPRILFAWIFRLLAK